MPLRQATSLSRRLAVAFAGGCAVALGLSLVAAGLVRVFDDRYQERGPVAHSVDVLVGYDRLDLKELLGEPRHALPELPPAPPLPPPAVRERTVRGFVMLSVDVDDEGRVRDARVVSAQPAGLYESQAIAEALAQTWPAGAAGPRDAVIRFETTRPISDESSPDD